MAAAQFRLALDQLWPYPPPAHEPGDLRLRRKCVAGYLVVCRTTHQPGPADLRWCCQVRILGLAGGDRFAVDQLSAGLYNFERIRGDGMADCAAGPGSVGRLYMAVLRHDS